MAANPTPSPVTDRSLSRTQIRAHIPIILDMNQMNYYIWRELFETHCLSFSVLSHLNGTSLPASPTDTQWFQIDGTIKMWIYGTISISLLKSVLKTNCTACDLWTSIGNLFRDNKKAPRSFNNTRSMLKDEEHRLKSKQHPASYHSNHTSSSPELLLASSPQQDVHHHSSTVNQYQNNRNGRGKNGNRGCNRRVRNNYRGNDKWNSNSQWDWPNPHIWPNYPHWLMTPIWPNSFWTNEASPHCSSNNPPPSSPSPTTNTAYHSTPTPPEMPPFIPQISRFVPTVLANAFNTMTIHPSDVVRFMDTDHTPQQGSLSSLSPHSFIYNCWYWVHICLFRLLLPEISLDKA